VGIGGQGRLVGAFGLGLAVAGTGLARLVLGFGAAAGLGQLLAGAGVILLVKGGVAGSQGIFLGRLGRRERTDTPPQTQHNGQSRRCGKRAEVHGDTSKKRDWFRRQWLSQSPAGLSNEGRPAMLCPIARQPGRRPCPGERHLRLWRSWRPRFFRPRPRSSPTSSGRGTRPPPWPGPITCPLPPSSPATPSSIPAGSRSARSCMCPWTPRPRPCLRPSAPRPPSCPTRNRRGAITWWRPGIARYASPNVST